MWGQKTQYHDRRDGDAQLDSLAKDIDYCREAKDKLIEKVDQSCNELNAVSARLSSLSIRTEDLERHRVESGRDIDKIKDLFSSSLSDLKKQISELTLTVTERLLSQEKQSLDQTTSMIESHDEKSFKYFEKIENRIDKNRSDVSDEFGKIHEKMDTFGKNLWKIMGGLIVLGFIVTYMNSPSSIQTQNLKTKTEIEGQLSELIVILKEKN